MILSFRQRRKRRNRPDRACNAGITGLFIAVIIIAACVAVWNLRVGRIADEMKYAQSLGVVLAEQPVRIIRLKNRVLNPVAQLFIDCADGLAQQIADA
jgi:hypothetical protein